MRIRELALVAALGLALLAGGCWLIDLITPWGPLTGTWSNTFSCAAVEWTEYSLAECDYCADVELKLKQKGNTLSGTIRLYNQNLVSGDPALCLIPPIGGEDDIRDGIVSGTRCEFKGAGFTWYGNLTSDLMYGAVAYEGLIPKEGEFHLTKE